MLAVDVVVASLDAQRVRLEEHVGASDLHLTEARDVNDRGFIVANAISNAGRRFAVHLVEIEPETPTVVNGVEVQAFPVKHPSGSPSFALRLTCEGKVICYTGDTEWVDALTPAAHEADLLIAEAYTAERPVRFHLDWATLQRHLPEISAKSVLLTHMSPDMLGRTPEAAEKAEDGLVVQF